MHVSLKPISIIISTVDRLERFRWAIFGLCSIALLLQFAAMVHLAKFLARESWLTFFLQVAALLALLVQLRKRRSLVWRARQYLSELNELGTFNITDFIQSTLRFKSLTALLFAWAVTALLACPFYVKSESAGLLAVPRAAIQDADPILFVTLWPVHATVLGVFLVILTFIFQFVSLRRAYETSLLPFLAERAHIKEIILVNFCFIFLEMLSLLLDKKSRFFLGARYIAILGFIFSVLSATYLLLRVLDLLEPDMIEDSLKDLVKRALAKELEQEQFLEIAAALLSDTCSASGIEYSEVDFFKSLPAIRSASTGKIADIDLNRLGRFCSNLRGTLPSSGESHVKCSLVATISDEITRYSNVLARVSSTDRTKKNEQLLRKAFRIEQYGDR